MSTRVNSHRVGRVATAVAALAISMSVTGVAEASPANPGDGLCYVGPSDPAAVYRNSDWARIYTLQVNSAMRVHHFSTAADGSTWAYGHGNGKPDSWTNAKNFNRCVIS